MWILVTAIATIFISSITIVPYLLELVTDKTTTGYLLLASFFNPAVDGIALLIVVVIALFSRSSK